MPNELSEKELGFYEEFIDDKLMIKYSDII